MNKKVDELMTELEQTQIYWENLTLFKSELGKEEYEKICKETCEKMEGILNEIRKAPYN